MGLNGDEAAGAGRDGIGQDVTGRGGRDMT